MRGKTVVQHVAIAGLVLAAVAAPAAAQAKLEFTPFFGSYYGAMTITDDADNDGSGTKLKQIPAASLGGALHVPLRIGPGTVDLGPHGARPASRRAQSASAGHGRQQSWRFRGAPRAAIKAGPKSCRIHDIPFDVCSVAH